jgi:isopentenyl diphosphate isomerase/L-lactate dehydrogenase-like FMN-dependent dehydrogenase
MTTPAIDLADIKTIGQVITAARKILDPGVFTWAASGAGVEVTVARNTQALGALALIPRLLVDVTNVEISTSFLGVPLQIPVMMAPIGALALYHPDDARASGEGAARAGTSIFCGILSDKPWEEVAATAPRRHFFQMYALGDRSWLGRVIERVENAAFAGICLTADSPAIARRDSSLAGGYEWNIYRGEGPANLADIGYDPEFKRSFTWSDLQWLNRATSLPLILKGVMSAADALRAIDCGVKGIYVSNHGGRAVDHGLSPMEVLAEIVAAVDGRAEVIVDSGFTRGAESGGSGGGNRPAAMLGPGDRRRRRGGKGPGHPQPGDSIDDDQSGLSKCGGPDSGDGQMVTAPRTWSGRCRLTRPCALGIVQNA